MNGIDGKSILFFLIGLIGPFLASAFVGGVLSVLGEDWDWAMLLLLQLLSVPVIFLAFIIYGLRSKKLSLAVGAITGLFLTFVYVIAAL